MAKKQQSVKYKKAPQAPRRFKSAYMFFSTEKHKEIRQELTDKNEKLPTTEVAKLVSQAWKDLTPEEREDWEELARRDKARYEVEKSMYSGPWKIPAKKRSQKDPAAPKRPMSAFLSFSNSKRALIRKEHPDIGNAQVSRILAQMWKEAPEEERKQHIEKEFQLRQDYKVAIADWKKKHTSEQQAIRQQREQIAMSHVDEGKMNGPAPVLDKPKMSAADALALAEAEAELEDGVPECDPEYVAMAPSSFMSAAAAGGGLPSSNVYSPSLAAIAMGSGRSNFGQPYPYSLGAPAYPGLASAVGPVSGYDDDLAAATSAYNAAAAGLYSSVMATPSHFNPQVYGGGGAASLPYGGPLADAAVYGMAPTAFYGGAVPNPYYNAVVEEPATWGYHLASGPSYSYVT